MNTPHKHAELIKKWADGAKVQYKPIWQPAWKDINNPSWDGVGEYRIKPTKVKGWINIYPFNDGWTTGSGVWETKEEAKKAVQVGAVSQQVEIEYEKE